MSNFPWQKAEKILVLTHASVDPDALGSLVAMTSFLRRQDKEVIAFVKGPVSQDLEFIYDGVEISFQEPDFGNFDLIIVLDCGVLERTRIDGIEAYRDQIVNIDHHPNPNFGNFNIIEKTASSTSEILFKMFSQNGWDIQPSEATAMLAGIVGDTGGFRHSNTTAETLVAAGALLSYGANLALINKTFFELSLAQIKARGLALENAYLDGTNKAIISGITAEDVEKLKLPEGSLAGIVELLNTCTEAQYAALCKQREDEVRVSLRTEEYKNFDVAELATKHGGGGMKLAAVFRVKGTLVKDEKGLVVELE